MQEEEGGRGGERSSIQKRTQSKKGKEGLGRKEKVYVFSDPVLNEAQTRNRQFAGQPPPILSVPLSLMGLPLAAGLPLFS